MRVESNQGNIAYVLIGGHANTTVRLDNLRYGPETTLLTSARGQYSIPLVPAGNYLVKGTPTGSHQPVSSGGNQTDRDCYQWRDNERCGFRLPIHWDSLAESAESIRCKWCRRCYAARCVIDHQRD